MERQPEEEHQQASSPRQTTRPVSALVAVVTLAGVIALTVVLTLWVSRDSERSGVEILIPEAAPVTFQISGEVIRPGVYSLDGEPRLIDAIDAAGGLTPDANEQSLNLAVRVRDGAKVVVPAIGEAVGADVGADILIAGESADDSQGAGHGTGLIDLNTATKDQLVALPGIGEVRADSIIQWRASNLISTVDDLLAISGIGPATVSSIREHVIQP